MPPDLRRGRIEVSIMRGYEWIWIVSGLALAVATYDAHQNPGDVFGIYRDASARWAVGQDLYLDGSGFQYLPTSAWLWTPLVALFDTGEGAMVWRWVNWSAFAVGAHLLATRLGVSGRRASAWIAALTGLVAWTAGKHGQATLMMVGATLIGLEAYLRGRAWLGAGALALAVAVKPLAIISLLLVLVTRPALGLRAAGLVLVLVAATLVHPSPGYALAQWIAVPAVLSESASDTVQGFGLFHAFSLLGGLGVDVGARQADTLRVLVALATAACVVRLDRRIPPASWPLLVYGASVLYLLLFSHRTENNTYGVLGPLLAVLTAKAWLGRRPLSLVGCAGVLITLQTSRTLGELVPELGPHVTRPAAALLCVLLVARELLSLTAVERGPARARTSRAPLWSR